MGGGILIKLILRYDKLDIIIHVYHIIHVYYINTCTSQYMYIT